MKRTFFQSKQKYNEFLFDWILKVMPLGTETQSFVILAFKVRWGKGGRGQSITLNDYKGKENKWGEV